MVKNDVNYTEYYMMAETCRNAEFDTTEEQDNDKKEKKNEQRKGK